MGRGNRTVSSSEKRGLFRRKKDETVEPQQILRYKVQVLNNVTGDVYTLTVLGDLRDARGATQPDLQKLNPHGNPCTLQLIEQQSGNKYGTGQQLILEEPMDWPPAISAFRIKVQGWQWAARELNERPLRQEISMTTRRDGHLQICLDEYSVRPNATVTSPLIIQKETLRTLTVDPEDEASTVASAEFLAEARQSIAEYEQARLSIDITAALQEEAQQRKAQEAQRLQEVLEQTIRGFDN